MLLRVRTQDGTKRMDSGEDWTIAELRAAIASLTGIRAEQQEILTGHPPKPIEVSVEDTVKDVFSVGELLTVEQALVQSQQTRVEQLPPDEVSKESELRFVRRRVPADHSCLFTCVGRLLQTGHSPGNLRHLIAEAVCSNPEKYNEVFLEKSPDVYRWWIQDPEHWGGAIELSILSSHFEVELAVVDIKALRIDCFGEGSGYSSRGYLIYSGIHYDFVVMDTGDQDVTLFSPRDESARSGALALGLEAQSARDYVDINSEVLVCNICRSRFTGEKAASQHALSTGHSDFGQG